MILPVAQDPDDPRAPWNGCTPLSVSGTCVFPLYAKRRDVGTDAEFQRVEPDENVNESIAADMRNSEAIIASRLYRTRNSTLLPFLLCPTSGSSGVREQ